MLLMMSLPTLNIASCLVAFAPHCQMAGIQPAAVKDLTTVNHNSNHDNSHHASHSSDCFIEANTTADATCTSAQIDVINAPILPAQEKPQAADYLPFDFSWQHFDDDSPYAAMSFDVSAKHYLASEPSLYPATPAPYLTTQRLRI